MPGGLWFRSCALATAVGAGLACVLLGGGVTVLLWAVGAAVAALLLVTLHTSVPADAGRDRPPVLRAATQAGALGAGFVGCCGYATLSPVLALLVLSSAVATSPLPRAILRRVPRGRALDDRAPVPTARPAPASHPHHVPELAPGLRSVCEPSVVRALSTAELCHTWRRTFLLLQQHNDASAAAAVVAVRQACLDEIERRDAAGLQAWLASGARAAGSPERFLAGATDGG